MAAVRAMIHSNSVAPAPERPAPALSGANLTLRFPGAPAPVLENLDIEIGRGEVVALVGGSGVGKSTLLRALAGLIAPEAGEIRLAGEKRPKRRRRAVVFQDARLLPWRRVEANIRYGLRGLGLSRAEQAARVRETLALTGVDELAQRWPHQLSGGQAQRVGIARALAVRPDVLLMDEPFSAVDAITRARLQDELARILSETGAGALFVTHDTREAAFLADRIVTLKKTGDGPARIAEYRAIATPRPRNRADPTLERVAAAIAASL